MSASELATSSTPATTQDSGSTSSSSSSAAPGRSVQLRSSLVGLSYDSQVQQLAPRAGAGAPVQRRSQDGGARDAAGVAGGAPSNLRVQRRAVQREALSTQGATTEQVAATTERVEGRGGEVTPVGDQLRASGASAAVNEDFEKDAKAFELALGRSAYGKAAGPAQTLAGRAKAYLTAKHQKWDARFKGLRDDLASIASDATWCGGVGDSVALIKSVFDDGNVRMVMQHIGKFYSTIMQQDMLNTKDSDYETWLAAAEIKVAEIKKAQAKAALENEVDGQKGARVWTGDNANMGATGQQMADAGMPLHPSEQQAQAQHAGGGEYDPQATLAWNQGAKVWALNEANAWVAKHREMSMPLAAGPSGTTKWLMEASLAIGGVTSSEARMACIGHLLPLYHHSLSEIMAAAAPFGCNDYTPGPQMYRRIDGFSEAELKGFGGGKFPDEPAATGTDATAS